VTIAFAKEGAIVAIVFITYTMSVFRAWSRSFRIVERSVSMTRNMGWGVAIVTAVGVFLWSAADAHAFLRRGNGSSGSYGSSGGYGSGGGGGSAGGNGSSGGYGSNGGYGSSGSAGSWGSHGGSFGGLFSRHRDRCQDNDDSCGSSGGYGSCGGSYQSEPNCAAEQTHANYAPEAPQDRNQNFQNRTPDEAPR